MSNTYVIGIVNMHLNYLSTKASGIYINMLFCINCTAEAHLFCRYSVIN